MRYLLLHPESYDPGTIATPLRSENVATRVVLDPTDLIPGDVPTAFVIDAKARTFFPEAALRRFVDAGGAIVAIGTPEEEDIPATLAEDMLAAFLRPPVGQRQLLCALRGAYRESAGRTETKRARGAAESRANELRELTKISIALTTERDLQTLLNLILTQARQVTQSDAGSLYLVEKEADAPARLRFILSQGHSRPDVSFTEFTIPIDESSMAGYVASTREPLVIDDVYFLPPDVEYSHNRSFDERYNYRTRSMLTIPMSDHHDEIIGVLQLINRKRDPEAVLETPEDTERMVVPFSKRTIDMVMALSSQAAVAIENSRLYQDIERLFEGFVRAAVTAIEQRDPTTFGHSGRVADMTVGLAEATDRVGDGPFSRLSFTVEEIREIRYAGLLHDFGKVGVREQVLVKAKKLYPQDLALVQQRFALVRSLTERNYYEELSKLLQHNGGTPPEEALATQRTAFEKELANLDRFLEVILHANEPSVLPEGSFEALQEIAERRYPDFDGKMRPLMTGDEMRFLSIRKGSLDEAERKEIESHVTHTYRFLLQIPWTRQLSSVPKIAYGHHEKLDGSGYPRKVLGTEIPVQTRMMTISDIYDALTARDRPYKPALPPDRALDIISSEVERGQLDPDLFEIFVGAEVFKIVHRSSS